jgi:threonine aldolase
MARYPADLHVGQKMALSITQATEAGTIYSLDEIQALSKIAKSAGLPVHMDGARFSNAICRARLYAGRNDLEIGHRHPVTWVAPRMAAGVPRRSYSSSRKWLIDMPHLRKRAANLFSKSTFVSAQFDEWLENDLWLKLAHHSNGMAEKLTAAVRTSKSSRLAWETGGNQLFIIINDETASKMADAGVPIRTWDTPESMHGKLGSEREDLSLRHIVCDSQRGYRGGVSLSLEREKPLWSGRRGFSANHRGESD